MCVRLHNANVVRLTEAGQEYSSCTLGVMLTPEWISVKFTLIIGVQQAIHTNRGCDHHAKFLTVKHSLACFYK